MEFTARIPALKDGVLRLYSSIIAVVTLDLSGGPLVDWVARAREPVYGDDGELPWDERIPRTKRKWRRRAVVKSEDAWDPGLPPGEDVAEAYDRVVEVAAEVVGSPRSTRIKNLRRRDAGDAGMARLPRS